MTVTIFKYPVENLANNSATNKLVALMQLASDPNPAVYSFYDFLPGLLIWLVFYLIIMLSLKLRGFSFLASFSATNIAILILTLLMYPLGIISGQLLVISIFLVPLSVLLMWIYG
jgi:hypothetical protein